MKILLLIAGLALLALVLQASAFSDQWLASNLGAVYSHPVVVAAREPVLTQEPRAVFALTHRRVVFEWLKASGVVRVA